jgi:type I restriction enzyme S subunit
VSTKPWSLRSFDDIVRSRGSGSAGLPQKEWHLNGAFPVIGQGAEPVEGWTDRIDLVVKAPPALVLYGGHTRRAKYVSAPFVPGPNVKILRPAPELQARFLFYFLEHLEVPTKGYADHFPLVRKSMIPVPSLETQQRIVAILDEAFAKVATALTNTAQNVRNARDLFASHLESVFTQRGGEWERAQLEALLERGWIEGHQDGNHGNNYPRKNEFVSEGVPYVSANCMADDRVDLSRAKYLTPQRAALIRTGVARNSDVLFAHNATVGPVAVLRTAEDKVILSTSLTYYRCNPKHILPEYLAHYMRSFAFRKQYLAVMTQSTRNKLPITKQREFYHVIPPLDEQRQLVRALDGILSDAQRLQAIYRRKLTALDELRQSVLHQAFTGAL